SATQSGWARSRGSSLRSRPCSASCTEAGPCCTTARGRDGTMLRDLTPVVAGRRLPAEQFRVHETSESVDREAVLSVLHGDLAAHRVRNYLSTHDCQRIQDNFAASPRIRPRYGEGEDGVEALILGASHIDKTTDDYLSDAAESADAVADLYRGIVDPFARFRTA